ncbi:hypothetical protein IV203_015171 [Nitzschia inconspicua]|uniref:Uncharacterized protein n=1 Tax=Nitzschia inconspicua TaxID=303405 RepID=A0A9K3LAI4_9STRA|nr:hypothetical protein IV203_015171 [Nitzschia inconspicua]
MARDHLDDDSNYAVIKKKSSKKKKNTNNASDGSRHDDISNHEDSKRKTAVIDKRKRVEELAKLCLELEQAREHVKQQKQRLLEVREEGKARKKKKKKKAGSAIDSSIMAESEKDISPKKSKNNSVTEQLGENLSLTKSPSRASLKRASLKGYLEETSSPESIKKKEKKGKKGRRKDGTKSLSGLDDSFSSIPGSVVGPCSNRSLSPMSLNPNKGSVRSIIQSANSSASSLKSPITPSESRNKKPFRHPVPSAFHSSFNNFNVDRSTDSRPVHQLAGISPASITTKLPSPSGGIFPPLPIPMRPPTAGQRRAKLTTAVEEEYGSPKSAENETKSVKSKSKALQAFFEQAATPVNKHKPLNIAVTPRTLKKGFLKMNVASPDLDSKPKVTPPKRFFDGTSLTEDKAQAYIESAMKVIQDQAHRAEVEVLVRRIDEAGGFPTTRRLSMRDNELVGRMVMAIRNDPGITSIEVTPEAFGTISSTLLDQFIQALRINLHLKSLTFSGVELGNDFLYAFADSMESNFVLEEVNLSRNLFTNAGLAEFCQTVATSNSTCKVLNLENQTTPISNASEYFVLEAFQQNKSLQDVKLDFQSDEAAAKLQEIISHNKERKLPRFDVDKKLMDVLRYEAERAEELWNEQNEEQVVLEVTDSDWNILYELSVLFDKRKLKTQIQEASEDFVPSTKRTNGDGMSKDEKKEFLFGAFKKNLEGSVACFNSDGSFLTPEFIAKYFKEDEEEDTLTFDFHGQWKLFKRFPIHDPDRHLIVTKFIDAIVSHPRANEITGINMANTGCGDDFLIALADRCLDNPSLLPNLYMVNFETNFINVGGIVALAALIASPNTFKYLQVVRLENQHLMLKSKAELALARAMRVNYSVVVMSITVRNLMERQQISKFVVRNLDFIRQARLRHLKATGQQRKRNQVERLFDNVAQDDPTIDTVDMTGVKRFLTLTREEKLKAARSIATNKHVRTIRLNSSGIDDAFVTELGKALEANNTVESIMLEGNDISGEGITALFRSLAKNTSVEEVRLHKQSKLIHTSDEHVLAEILEPNSTLTKVGIDLRTTMAQVQLNKKLELNRNLSLKMKAASKGGDFEAMECIASIKV